MSAIQQNKNDTDQSQKELLSLRVAGLVIRRKAGREFHSYTEISDYSPSDYEVLLRRWTTEGHFLLHLAAFSGPAVDGEDPELTLLKESKNWSINLANKAGLTNVKGLDGRRAVFLSVHNGTRREDYFTKKPLDSGVFLCYVVPVTHSESSVVSRYPNSPQYPQFYNLSSLQETMVDDTANFHPYTREMLSSLDHWLREQHALPRAINLLFSPSLQNRLNMFVSNPMFSLQEECAGNQTPLNQTSHQPFLTSTPFPKSALTSSTFMADKFYSEMGLESVDLFVKNPLFGSGLGFQSKVERIVVNKHFGMAPNYDAASNSQGKWMVQIQGDGLPDWVDMFPLHKCACEGDLQGVRKCIRMGISPDERDTDSWAPLHYACWYGELGVVRVLVDEASAVIGIQNSSGSTPLHLAAATGHSGIVSFLLKHKGMDLLKVALDEDGKTPLAVCLECKTNDWQETAQLLREAYKEQPNASGVFPHSLVSSPQPQILDQQVGTNLDLAGSLADLLEEGVGLKKHHRKLKDNTVRRQRINFMSGQYQVVHFFRGRKTVAGDVLKDIAKLIQLDSEYHIAFSLWIVSDSLDHNIALHRPGFMKDKINQILPASMITSRRKVEFERRVLATHAEISQQTSEGPEFLYLKYLRHCWQWIFYGCTFFSGTLVAKARKLSTSYQQGLGKKSTPVSVGISTQGIIILSRDSNALVQHVGFERLEWDVSAEKQEVLFYSKDGIVNLLIYTKKAALIYSIVSRMMEQYLELSHASTSVSIASAAT